MKYNKELQRYINEIKQYNQSKQFSKEDNIELFKRYNNGEKELLKDLFYINALLVVKIANKFSSRLDKINLDIMDLIQYGNLSLIKAIERYNYSYNTTFSTYACVVIKKDLSEMIIKYGYPVKYHRRGYNKIKKYNEIYNLLFEKLNREPSIYELADALNISEEKVLEIKKFISMQNVVSLNSPVLEDCCDLVEIIEDTNNDELENILTKISINDTIEVLKKMNLTEKEFQVIMLRFGFLDGKVRTQIEIAKQFNCSNKYIWYLEKNALKKIYQSKYIYELLPSSDLIELDNIKKI